MLVLLAPQSGAHSRGAFRDECTVQVNLAHLRVDFQAFFFLFFCDLCFGGFLIFALLVLALVLVLVLLGVRGGRVPSPIYNFQ